jgi:hypothetical protein
MYSKTPYSTEKDIIPLAVIAQVPMLLVANHYGLLKDPEDKK